MAPLGLLQKEQTTQKLPLVDVRFTHALCIGQTGSGKTTAFIYPNLHKRLELGHGILFFDIKGSEHRSVKLLAAVSKRLRDVVEIAKPWGESINLLENFNAKSFEKLLHKLVGEPKNGGQNTYFYNEAIGLGKTIYRLLELRSTIVNEILPLKEELVNYSSMQKYQTFSLKTFYNAITSIEALYEFIEEAHSFSLEVKTILKANYIMYHREETAAVYKNTLLNLLTFQEVLETLDKYRFNELDRENTSKFDPSLLSVISTLASGFNFMLTQASEYICNTHNPFNIVKALEEKKIVIINVRVIPDSVVEVLLEQIFEHLIDLNQFNYKKQQPISIFIDEAQRLINKDIPLDVLRSSKVDVIMAIQSELQLISKFNSHTHWEQLSINIAQKFAFHSSTQNATHLESFFYDPSTLDTFEYVKEYENKKQKANPYFLAENGLERAEQLYQRVVLKLPNLPKNHYYIYDVALFEKKREILLMDIENNTTTPMKFFSKEEELRIEQELKRLGFTAFPPKERLRKR